LEGSLITGVSASSLPSLVRKAEFGEDVELTWRGEPVAVLIGWRQSMRRTSRYRRFSEAYGEVTRAFALAELSIDPDEVFAGARGDTRGREVDL